MIFIYDSETAVVPANVNGKQGLAVQLESGDEGFGDAEAYGGDELLFESRDVAVEWARDLLTKLEA